MSISKKLSIIVALTIIEVSFTIWAAFQISKGATFHQLNSLHLKYANQFSQAIVHFKNSDHNSTKVLKEKINKVRNQPIACLEQVGLVDKIVMKSIQTDYALGLCEKDLRDADYILKETKNFEERKISKKEYIVALESALDAFNDNSAQFEGPITNTVTFIFRTMIPMVIFISFFNILFITYLSRNISSSIKRVIELLSQKNNDSKSSFKEEVTGRVSGELKDLLIVAQKKITDNLLNSETNSELKAIVDEKTQSLQSANEELMKLNEKYKSNEQELEKKNHELFELNNEIQSSKLLQDLMMNKNPDLLFVKDEEFKLVHANEAFINLYPEEQRDQIIGYTTLEKYDPKEVEEFLAKDKEAFATGYSESYERITFPDNKVRSLFTQKIRFVDAQNRPYILGIGRDVTKQLQEEDMLSKLYDMASNNDLSTESKIQKALEFGVEYFNLSTGIVSDINQESYAVKYVFSDQGIDMKGMTFDLKETYCEYTYRSEKVASYDDASQSRLASHPSFINMRLHSYIGTTVYVDGKAFGTINFTAKDPRKVPFTDKEKSMLLLLAQWVGFEITRSESDQQLRVTNNRLEKTNEELGQFAYRTSHDLKAPLATIKGLATFMAEDLESGDFEEVANNISVVYKHAEKLEKLVVDILNLAKSDLQEQELSLVNISELIADLKESYFDLLNEKKVELKYEDDNHCAIWTQETRLKMILGNLVSNAIKYSNPHKDKSFVKVQCKLDDKVRITISDNGVGIADGDKEKLFDLFSRFNADLAEGSGLGMSIVKKNVDALGGEISLDSSEDGTTFYLILPRVEGEK